MFRRAKITHENRKKVKKFHNLKCWMFSFEGWRLLLLLGRPLWRPWERNIATFDQKNILKNSALNFVQFFIIKTLDRDSMILDPKHRFFDKILEIFSVLNLLVRILYKDPYPYRYRILVRIYKAAVRKLKVQKYCMCKSDKNMFIFPKKTNIIP